MIEDEILADFDAAFNYLRLGVSYTEARLRMIDYLESFPPNSKGVNFIEALRKIYYN